MSSQNHLSLKSIASDGIRALNDFCACQSPRNVLRRRFIRLIVSGSTVPILLTQRFLSIAHSCRSSATVGASKPFTLDGSIRSVKGNRNACRLPVHGIALIIPVGVSAAMIAGRRPRCSWPFEAGNSIIQISPFFTILIPIFFPSGQTPHR